MEFHIAIEQSGFDPAAVQDLLLERDPSALAVMNKAGDTLRVFAETDIDELAQLMASAGTPVPPGRIAEMPSLCCGGCST